MKNIDDVQTTVNRCRAFMDEGRKNEARTLAVAAHAETLKLALTFPRGSYEESCIMHFLGSFNDIVRNCT